MIPISGKMRSIFQGDNSDAGYFADGALGSEFLTKSAISPGPARTSDGMHVSTSGFYSTLPTAQQAMQISSDFSVNGYRWTHTVIKWSFAGSNYDNQQGHNFAFSFAEGSAERDLIAQAISLWDEAATNLTFQQVADGEDVDIRLGWGNNLDNGSGSNTLGQTWSFSTGTHTLVLTGGNYNTLTQALIQIDWADEFSDLPGGSASDKSFLNVAMHEIGHALGLADYDLATAIMNAAASNLDSLTSHEVNGIEYLYPDDNVGPELTAIPTNPTYVENGAPVTLFRGAVASTIEAGQTITAVTLTISGLANDLNERLLIDGTVIPLRDGTYIGTLTNGLTVNISIPGSTATVTFAGANLSISAFQDLINRLGYSYEGDRPTEGNRTFTITQIVDSGSNISPHNNETALNIVSTVSVTAVNDAPLVNRPAGVNVSATKAQALQVSSLFSGSDLDGDTLTYFLYDGNSAANSGRFMVGGNAVAAGTIVQVTAAQFAQATFVAGAAGTSDSIAVQAFDGTAYSDWNASVNVSVPANRAPTVSTPAGTSVVPTAGQTMLLSSLFSANDLDGDTLTYYVYDSSPATNSGRVKIGSTTVAAQTITAMTATQFTQATFVAGAAGSVDNIYFQSFDGTNYSGWNAIVNVAVPVNRAPTVSLPSGASVKPTSGQTMLLSSLFSGNDLDGDTLTYYVYDSSPAANSGRVKIGSTMVAAGAITAMTSAQFAQATFVAGAAGSVDNIYVQTFDGSAYSGWNASVNLAVPTGTNRAPTVSLPSGNSVVPTSGQTIKLSSLFNGNDPDGNTLTYLVYDGNAAANSGHFVVSGNTVAAGTITAMTAAQFAQATFVAGAAGMSDSISVQTFDGQLYSGWNAIVNIAVPAGANHAPTVSTPAGASVAPTAGQTMLVSSLFSGSDVDGNGLTYLLYDGNSAANSGHFVVGGNVVAAGTITPVTAAQLAQATFVAGAAGVSDSISVQAYDGQLYSGWNAMVNVAVPAGTNHAPTVNLPSGNSANPTAGQTLQMSSLFAGSDVDGNTLTYFVYDNNSAADSGHVVIDGNRVAAQTITAMTAAQLASATFVAGASGSVDDILVQAFDGQLYSGWASGVHLFV